MRDLGMGKAQVGEAESRVGLIAAAVTRLLRGSAVVSNSIRLDHQPKLRPVEIDEEAIEAVTRQWQWQVRVPDQTKETTLELGIGETEGVRREQRAQRRDPPLSPVVGEGGKQGLRVDYAKPIGLADRPLELV